MKKRKNNKIPAYAFGIDAIGNAMGKYAGLADLVGSGIQSATQTKSVSGGEIAGGALGGAAKGASMGMAAGPIGAIVGGVAGLAGGLFTGFKKRKAALDKRNRENTLESTQAGLNIASNAQQEYWDDNELAYTYANGGIIANDLAYVDNNEIIRDVNGNIDQVPNTRPGTDNHLIDATSLESVLSDKIKRPGTNKTFAQEGEKLAKMIKPSKNKDTFAENTDRLNKINANKKYNQLLQEQEQVKQEKGITPKSKGIPAYADGGKNKMRFGIWDVTEVDAPSIALPYNYFNINTKNVSDPNAVIDKGRFGIYNPTPGKFNKNAAYNSQSALMSPTIGAWNVNTNRNKKADNYVDAVSYANDQQVPDSYLPKIETTTMAESAPASTKLITKPNYRQSTKPTATKTSSAKVNSPGLTQADPWASEMFADPMIRPVSTIKIDDKMQLPSSFSKTVGANEDKPAGRKGFNFDMDYSDLMSASPMLFNAIQAMKGPEIEQSVINPYSSSISGAMAKRRMNIQPAIAANARARAISNYNLSNMNTGTGTNLAARTQAAVDEYARNADMYATKQNADNSYLGEYANTLNNLGGQWVNAINMNNDINARNRAASRNFGSTVSTQLSNWLQNRTKMKNEMKRDEMLLPFLNAQLEQGFTSDIMNQYKNRLGYGK